jgi:hypothetical protein
MGCDEAEQLLACLFDDDIGPSEENPFLHVQVCPECGDLFVSLILLKAVEGIAGTRWKGKRGSLLPKTG